MPVSENQNSNSEVLSTESKNSPIKPEVSSVETETLLKIFNIWKDKLNILKFWIESIEPVNELSTDKEDLSNKKYFSDRLLLSYVSFIILLYASLEKFIENIVTRFAILESARIPYKELPNKLTKKHILRTTEIITRGHVGEGRYKSVTELDLVKNLADCMTGVEPYKLNGFAIAAHDTNLRSNEIDAMFAIIGIEGICTRVVQTDTMFPWYRNTEEFIASDSLKDTNKKMRDRIINNIQKIIDNRNQVAHGEDFQAIPNVNNMKADIAFIQVFVESVFSIVVGQYLKHYKKDDKKDDIIQLIQRSGDGPFQKGTIVIIEPPTYQIFCDQCVFVLGEEFGARWGRIQNIQLNGNSIPIIEPNLPKINRISIQLNFKCPRNADLIALKVEDKNIWDITSSNSIKTT
jgi:hypothetical protein